MSLKDHNYRAILLGMVGTATPHIGTNDWRKDRMLPALEHLGVDTNRIKNPIVSGWGPEHQALEKLLKQDDEVIQFYLIGNPGRTERTPHSGYAIVQIMQSVLTHDVTPFLFFDPAGLDSKTQRALNKIVEDVTELRPGVVVPTWNGLVQACTEQWLKHPQMVAVLQGTSGNNPWTHILFEKLETNGVDTTRFLNPMVQPGEWNSAVQLLEDQMRAIADTHICYLGDPQENRLATDQLPPYSLAELWIALHRNPENVMVCFDYQGLGGHSRQVLEKIHQDIHRLFPGVPVTTHLDTAAELLAARLLSSTS